MRWSRREVDCVREPIEVLDGLVTFLDETDRTLLQYAAEVEAKIADLTPGTEPALPAFVSRGEARLGVRFEEVNERASTCFENRSGNAYLTDKESLTTTVARYVVDCAETEIFRHYEVAAAFNSHSITHICRRKFGCKTVGPTRSREIVDHLLLHDDREPLDSAFQEAALCYPHRKWSIADGFSFLQ